MLSVNKWIVRLPGCGCPSNELGIVYIILQRKADLQSKIRVLIKSECKARSQSIDKVSEI